MLKQRNATAHSWASCNLVCTLKNLKHLCLFSSPFAGKRYKEKSSSLPLLALNWNVKGAVDQCILISMCKWDLGWQGIFSASEIYYKVEMIKILSKVTVCSRYLSSGCMWHFFPLSCLLMTSQFSLAVSHFFTPTWQWCLSCCST